MRRLSLAVLPAVIALLFAFPGCRADDDTNADVFPVETGGSAGSDQGEGGSSGQAGEGSEAGSAGDAGSAGTAGAGPSGGPLRVVTFNTENFFNDKNESTDPSTPDNIILTTAQYQTKLAGIAKILQKLDADVILLQEVENDAVLADLAARPELGGAFVERVLFPGNDPRGIDIAALSKIPFTKKISHRNESFVAKGGTGKMYKYARDCLELRMKYNNRELVLLGVHFKAKSNDDPQKRLAEAQHTRFIADTLTADDPSRAVIILGDFNDFPGSAPISAIEGTAPEKYLGVGTLLPSDLAWTAYSQSAPGGKALHDNQNINVTAAGMLNKASVTILHDTQLEAALRDISDHAPVAATYDVHLGRGGLASASTRRERRDLGKTLSRAASVLFACVGGLPLLLALALRTPWVRTQAAQLTQQVLREQLALETSFSLQLQLLPPSIVLEQVKIPSTDGGESALEIERISVTPRLFSLLGGRMDVGDIELERPRVRLVIEDGALKNVSLKLPESDPNAPKERISRLPFRLLSMTDAMAKVELRDAGVSFEVEGFDIDASASGEPALETSLSLDGAKIQRRRVVGGETFIDDDVLCGLRARVLLSESGIMVRRLELLGRLDDDREAGTYPTCLGPPSSESLVELTLRQMRVSEGPGVLPVVNGQLGLQLPLRLVNRLVPGAPSLTGDVGLDASVSFAGREELPTLTGRLTAHEIELFGEKTVAHKLDAKIESDAEEFRLVEGHVAFGGGEVVLRDVKARPFAPGIPIEVGEAEIKRLKFPALMSDLGITDHTIVQWTFDSGGITNFRGHVIDPVKNGPSFIGDISVQTSGFELFTSGWDDPARQHVVAVKNALCKGKFGVEPNGIVFKNMSAAFNKTRLDVPYVIVGFEDALEVRVGPGTHLELADISPLVTLPLSGGVDVTGLVHGGQDNPRIDGELKATNFKMADMPLADAMTAKVEFVPFVVDFKGVKAQKGRSSYDASLIRIDLNKTGVLAVDGQVTSKGMDFRDLLAIFQFEDDPRYEDIYGQGDVKASLHFQTGGAADVCDTGVIAVRAQAQLGLMSVYGERYDGGDADLDFNWFDREALERGMEVNLRSVTLKKGRGTIFGAGSLGRDAVLRGHFVAHDVPLARVDAFGDLGRMADGTISAAGEVSGTLDAMELDGSVQVSPVRVGQRVLPQSQLSFKLVPTLRKPAEDKPAVSHKCKNEIPQPFSLKEYERDASKGVYHVDGTLFGGQVVLDDYTVTWQRDKVAGGKVAFNKLDLGSVFQLSPSMVLSDAPPRGFLSGLLELEKVELDHLERAKVSMRIDDAEIARGSYVMRLSPKSGGAPAGELRVEDDTLTLNEMTVGLSVGEALGARMELGGQVRALSSSRELALEATLLPLDIGTVLAGAPRIERASGKLEGTVAVTGWASNPIARGELRLRDAALQARGMPVSLEDLQMTARIDEREIRVVRATAKAGGGTLSMSAQAPLKGFEIGELTARLMAEDVRLPVIDGVEMRTGADLLIQWQPQFDGVRRKAKLTGNVDIGSFVYTRPITISADLDSLTKRGRRTTVDVYDPENDLVDLSLSVRAKQPLVFRNNLIEADVLIDSEALVLTGTNQRFGLRGQMRVGKGGLLRLRANEFEINQGTIRFDDPTRIAPRVDIAATTDYRRYTSSTSAPAGAATAVNARSAGGSWRIAMHAYGDADDLKLDLSSEPNLAQEDIVLLLTIGMTRAELDQLQTANLGSAAAFEALSALSGADKAVKTAIPIIDDFRFGSAYSTRTGRTEPTVTVGKRISDRLRANIITGLSENRDVRSNVEWRISPTTSVLGNYDNLNDVTSQGLGNLGADFRIRLEFLPVIDCA